MIRVPLSSFISSKKSIPQRREETARRHAARIPLLCRNIDVVAGERGSEAVAATGCSTFFFVVFVRVIGEAGTVCAAICRLDDFKRQFQ